MLSKNKKLSDLLELDSITSGAIFIVLESGIPYKVSEETILNSINNGYYLQQHNSPTAVLDGITYGMFRVVSGNLLISGDSSHLTVDGILNAGRIQFQNNYIPSTSASSGTSGEMCFDSNYAYFCVGTNSWKRVTLDTF